ncbi:MAG: hypothetical protein V6Z81_06415 [Parvularculales bacterium]
MTVKPQANVEDFMKGYAQQKRRAGIYNFLMWALLVAYAIVIWQGVSFVYEVGFYAEVNDSGTLWVFLPWLITMIVLSVPFIIGLWILNARRREALALAYGFQRKAIVEERVFAYLDDDDDFRRQMLRDYVQHWMAKSPLEVVLALHNKGSNSFSK